MASRRFLVILACLPLSACAATQAETTPRSEPGPITSTQPTSWEPNALPQPVNRLGDTTSIAPAPAEPEPEAEVPAPAPTTVEAPAPQVETVTVHAPAPAPRPALPQRPKPKLELPDPPQIPIPPEVQDGLNHIPTLPPLPRAEDIHIDLPF